MSDNILDERRRGLEEAFFAQQERALMERMRAADAAKDRRAALAAATGLADGPALDGLLATNLPAEAVAALNLVPHVLVAWADGTIQPPERHAILGALDARGMGEPARSLVASWLDRRPPDSLQEAWLAYTRALAAGMDPAGRAALKQAVLGNATAVAETAGGFLGMGGVSDSERRVLDRLAAAFG